MTEQQIVMKREELNRFRDEIVSEITQKLASQKSETLLTVKQTCAILGINRSTLYRWAQSHYFEPVKLGGKVLYRESDVKSIRGGEL